MVNNGYDRIFSKALVEEKLIFNEAGVQGYIEKVGSGGHRYGKVDAITKSLLAEISMEIQRFYKDMNTEGLMAMVSSFTKIVTSESRLPRIGASLHLRGNSGLNEEQRLCAQATLDGILGV